MNRWEKVEKRKEGRRGKVNKDGIGAHNGAR